MLDFLTKFYMCTASFRLSISGMNCWRNQLISSFTLSSIDGGISTVGFCIQTAAPLVACITK